MNDSLAEKEHRAIEHCYRTTSVMVNPIVDWTDDDVWEFLHHYGYSANPLYQCGKKRIGCIGCPMQGLDCAWLLHTAPIAARRWTERT